MNNVVLMGRLTADPELKQTPSGVFVTTFTVAVNRSYVKQGEERQADFISCVAWRGTAEFITKYFLKGQMIAVQGSIQTRSYEDKQGNKRKAVEVVVEKGYFCGNKDAGNGRSYVPAHGNPDIDGEWQRGKADRFAEIDDTQDVPF